MKTSNILVLTAASLLLWGCRQAIIDRTDRAVYQVIEQRQLSTVGFTADARVGSENGDMGQAGDMYSFVPRPLTPELPEAFRTQPSVPGAADDALPQPGDMGITAQAPTDEEPPESEEEEASPEVFTKEELDRIEALGLRFGLRRTLAYSVAHARDLQDAKEDLYLAALDLTLERHLWTPQFVASVQGEFADYGQVRDFDRAMSTVSDVTVIQSLPYGGEVSARVLSSLMRDLGSHITSGESGTAIIEAGIPLFRGAGLVAYESRIQAERELIYAVRDYERFRRSFLVLIAGDYFDLQQSKAQIANSYKAYLSRKARWEEEDLKNQLGQSDMENAYRAKASMRNAESSLVSSKTRYESALDRFKIVLGMPVDHLLDVVNQEDDAESRDLERLLPHVSIADAVDVALTFRLDLLNDADRVDDARRNMRVAKNRMLPDLDLSGSVTMNTDSNRKNSLSYNTERTTWRGFINLRIDDRKTERNAYRGALIQFRRAQRGYEESVDIVRADVRSADRDLQREEELLAIEGFSVEENQFRLAAATAREKLGKINNQEFVDAQDSLLSAENSLADAVAGFRRAILRYRLATGTLRITEDGWWGENLGSTD